MKNVTPSEPPATFAGTGLKVLLVSIRSVKVQDNDRAMVAFRTARSLRNPSGLETALTPPLSTLEGAQVASLLKMRVRTFDRRRLTILGLSFEDGDNGRKLRVISKVG